MSCERMNDIWKIGLCFEICTPILVEYYVIFPSLRIGSFIDDFYTKRLILSGRKGVMDSIPCLRYRETVSSIYVYILISVHSTRDNDLAAGECGMKAFSKSSFPSSASELQIATNDQSLPPLKRSAIFFMRSWSLAARSATSPASMTPPRPWSAVLSLPRWIIVATVSGTPSLFQIE